MPTKSGKYWVTWANTPANRAMNSIRVDDLVIPFKTNVKAFIKALTDAGATIVIKATKRSKKRAYLFHWAWKISLGKCKPSDPEKITGIDIQWDHGDDKKSKAAATEMRKGFGLKIPPKSTVAPSLTSNHIPGKAIDMTITWADTIKIKKKNGEKVSVVFMANVNGNKILHQIGASYGVKKHIRDAPHWSFNGR